MKVDLNIEFIGIVDRQDERLKATAYFKKGKRADLIPRISIRSGMIDHCKLKVKTRLHIF